MEGSQRIAGAATEESLFFKGICRIFLEVNLGLLPGAGGTQRLPRIIGPLGEFPKMMLTGKHVPAKKAEEMGIIDKITDADGIEESMKSFT